MRFLPLGLAALLLLPGLAGCLGAPRERAALQVSPAFDLRRLTATGGIHEGQPAVSGDGSMLVYTAFVGFTSRVYALDLASGATTRLSAAGATHDTSPAVSGNGKTAAWVTVADGDSDIVASQTDGSGFHAITRNSDRDVDPALSHDGGLVAFVSNRWGNPEVVVARTDGSGERRLTFNTVPEFQPTFSRDGNRIAYISYPAGSQVYLINADASGERRITDNQVINAYPDLDRTGARVVYAAGPAALRDIYVQEVGGAVQALTASAWDEWTPRITADGKTVVFRSEGARNASDHLIMAVQADGAGLMQLGKGQDFGMSADGSRIVIVAQDDLWLLTRR